jgi:hypothetical protein
MRRFGVELPCHIDAGPRRQSSRHSGKSNGDIIWVKTWQSNRQISLVCDCISLVIFFWSYFLLWRAQREDHM